MSSNKKGCVLLTGGAGYIGSHTAVELLRSGYEVVIADDLRNSNAAVLPRIAKLGGAEPAFYRIDVCDEEALCRVFDRHEIDSVIHFAGLKCVPESVKDPVSYYRNNLDATLMLLEAMKEHVFTRLVFSSSATVYGDPARVPIDESMPVGACTNPYGMTKYMSEVMIRDACKADPELSAVLLRYFNPIGADESGEIVEDPEGIPNNLLPYIAQVAVGRREKLFVNGNDYPTPDGTGVRDYIHVTDLAKGHVAAIEYAAEHAGCEAINLGTGRGSSVMEVLRSFERACGHEIPYEIAPRRAGDIAVCYADPAKAERLLGWKAEKDIDDMCRDTWRWQSGNPHGYKQDKEK